MKRFLVFILPLPLLLAFVTQTSKPSTAKSYLVTIRVTQTTAYCGGAAPSQEMIQEANTPKPYPNQTYYLRPGSKNSLTYKKMIKVKTDSAGVLQVKLKPGKYILIYPSQVNKPDTVKLKQNKNYEFAGMDCLNNWWSKGWQVITVTNKNQSLTFNLHHPCFEDPVNAPCMEYRGPYPP